jgi:hypothetical protein
MSAVSVASADSSTSFIDQALALVGEMSFSDKLSFNAKFASLLAKETKGAGAVAKAAKKEKKEKDPNAPKRVAGAGQKAWFAYIEHCLATMPERFEGVALRKDKLAVVKGIRAEDKAGYDAFVAKYKEEHPSASAEAAADAESDDEGQLEEEDSKPIAAPKAAEPKPMTAAEKIAAIKAKRATEAAASVKTDSAKAEAKPTPSAEAAKAPKKPLVKGTAKPKVAVKEDDGSLGRITIDGQDYHRDTSMNGLWKVADDGEGFGAWVGYYQPGNEDQPIRFTDFPADE